MKLVTDRFAFEMPPLTYPGTGRQLPGTGTQLVTDWFAYELPPPVPDRLRDDLTNSVPGYERLPQRAEVYNSIRSPEADLMDMVAHLQKLKR